MNTQVTQDEVTDLNDVNQTGPRGPDREAIAPGDYPVLSLLSVEDSESEEFGKYTWIHAKVIKSAGKGATEPGTEVKIGIKRDGKGNLGLAKAISLATFLDVVNGGRQAADRNEFLGSLKSGGGVGTLFAANLELAGRAKKYTFRAAEQG